MQIWRSAIQMSVLWLNVVLWKVGFVILMEMHILRPKAGPNEPESLVVGPDLPGDLGAHWRLRSTASQDSLSYLNGDHMEGGGRNEPRRGMNRLVWRFGEIKILGTNGNIKVASQDCKGKVIFSWEDIDVHRLSLWKLRNFWKGTFFLIHLDNLCWLVSQRQWCPPVMPIYVWNQAHDSRLITT